MSKLSPELLAQQLTVCDSTDSLQKVYACHQSQSAFIDALLQLLERPEHQDNASWLIKYHTEQAGGLSLSQQQRFYQLWPVLLSWQSQLHCLQIMEVNPVPESLDVTLMPLLKHWLQGKNKFVRAWSYNGMYLLAKQSPAYTEEVKTYLQRGLTDEAPSVKARLKKLRL